jgi:phosphoribosylaminoimidazolecarboxamide formyltransferase/IMP cyclohydrolase
MPKRALLSVSDKAGIADVARRLQAMGYEILSTGGTQILLQKEHIPVKGVEEVTGFPECFGGRVKTMHPLVMGGVLFRRDNKDDQKQAKDLKIEPIDLVIVNLYPFKKTKEDMSKTRADVIEQIDIGGPTLLRSAAKNHASVTVICDPADYERVLSELQSGDTSPQTREQLAAKVFLHTAGYDAMIAEYLSNGAHTGLVMTGGRKLRYGENPHQWGMFFEFYEDGSAAQTPPYTPLQGKEMSYLNILDADAAWTAVQEFTDPTAVFVKHANPSGIASHAKIEDAFQRAYDTDRLSAFGVIIALNRPCTEAIAKKIIDQKIFTEVVVAPIYEPAALELFKQKPNIRVIVQTNGEAMRSQILYRSVKDGMLIQNPDTKVVTAADLKCVTEKKPTDAQIADLLFAWKAVKVAKSNAIVLAKDGVTVGIGCGQTSRVDSTWIALKRAGDRAKGSALASDAFFPFPDAIEEAAKNGIAAVIQPGGSVRDEEVFKRANELGLVMVLTNTRAFRH